MHYGKGSTVSDLGVGLEEKSAMNLFFPRECPLELIFFPERGLFKFTFFSERPFKFFLPGTGLSKHFFLVVALKYIFLLKPNQKSG